MPVCRRKAYVEFTGKKTVIITTPLVQKKFELEDEFFGVDLITLKEFDSFDSGLLFINPPSSFLINFLYDEIEDSYIGEVIAQIEEDEMDVIGISDWKKHNRKLFKVSVWQDD